MKKTLLFIFALCACDRYKYEYAAVKEVLICSGEQCRVLLDNGNRATIIGVVVKGDNVYTKPIWETWSVIK